MNAVPAALIFDMDGVIVDSTATHTEAWLRYLANKGLAVEGVEQRMLGRHNDDIVRDFFGGHDLTTDLIAEHGAAKERLYREMIGPVLDARLVPGVLDFIRRHREWPLAVATNAEPANVAFILEAAAVRDCFRIIIDGHEVEQPKPHPEIYLLTAARLRVDPAECIVFEDSLTGVAAAHAAGMRVVGVATTLADLPDVDLTIRDFNDESLEPWLQEALACV